MSRSANCGKAGAYARIDDHHHTSTREDGSVSAALPPHCLKCLPRLHPRTQVNGSRQSAHPSWRRAPGGRARSHAGSWAGQTTGRSPQRRPLVQDRRSTPRSCRSPIWIRRGSTRASGCAPVRGRPPGPSPARSREDRAHPSRVCTIACSDQPDPLAQG